LKIKIGIEIIGFFRQGWAGMTQRHILRLTDEQKQELKFISEILIFVFNLNQKSAYNK
jgi:hypothetical protein